MRYLGALVDASPGTPPSTSVVYFIQATHGGPIKIGTTTFGRLDQRRRDLQSGNPHPLVVRRCVLGGRTEEVCLHSEFRDLRCEGEWFEVSDELRGIANALPSDTAPLYAAAYECGHTEGCDEGYLAGRKWMIYDMVERYLQGGAEVLEAIRSAA